MEFLLNKIEERDMDFVVMRTFAELPAFSSLFLNKIGLPTGEVISIEHSFMDNELGESDITVIVSLAGRRFALLIENKIDAHAMPDQCSRYFQRGIRGCMDGKYDDFAVFIIAPQAYLVTNKEAKKYKNQISYEELLSFFIANRRALDAEITQAAIAKQSCGYTVQEVPAITDFWNKLYAYCRTCGRTIEMYAPNGAKGARATSPMFKSAFKGTELYYKANSGKCELIFLGKRSDANRLKAVLQTIKDEDMHWAEAGQSLALYIEAKPMDFKVPFETYTHELDLMVRAIERLTKLSFLLNDTGFVI